MNSLREKLTKLALSRIRNRALEAEHKASAIPAGRAQLREARWEDFEGVRALTTEFGQGTDSIENWRRLWRDNPAIKSGTAPARIGWVLECEKHVVGFLGTIPLLYTVDGSTLVAATTCRLAVVPQHRAATAMLVMSFFRQKEIKIFLNTTATPAAGQIMSALRAQHLPQQDYSTVFYWILNSRSFAKAALSKLGVSPVVASFTSPIAGAVFAIDRLFSQRGPVSGKGKEISNVSWEGVGEEFDRFCSIQAGLRSFLAVRSGEWMRWHFLPPNSERKAVMLFCREAGRLVGYAVVREVCDSRTGMRSTQLADLLTESDREDIISALFEAVYSYARAAGSGVLEVIGFPEPVRRVLRIANPNTRQFPAPPYFYKTADSTLSARLTQGSMWYACPYDGDTTLWP